MQTTLRSLHKLGDACKKMGEENDKSQGNASPVTPQKEKSQQSAYAAAKFSGGDQLQQVNTMTQ